MTNDNIAWLESGTAKIAGQPYRIVREPQMKVDYTRKYYHESPYEQGLPPELTHEEITWHSGGFKSHPGLDGTSEYGYDTDARWPFRLMPGPYINIDVLTDATPAGTSSSTPIWMFDALGYLFVLAGRYIWRITPGTPDAIQLSYDFGAFGTTGFSGVSWHNGATETAYVGTIGVNSLYWLTAAGIGTGPGGSDSWTNAAVNAFRLAVGASRMFKITSTGELQNIVSGLDPAVAGNWGDSVQVGNTTDLATSLVAFDRTVLVGKPEGLFAVGDEGFGVPQIKRMAYHPFNCYGAINWDPYILVPHARGLYRYYPGEVVDVGLETEWLNESPVRGQVTALCADGNGFWFFIKAGTHTFICFARARKGQEASMGPMILDTVSFLPSKTSFTAHMTAHTASFGPRLYFGYGFDIGYVQLSDIYGSPDIIGTDYLFSQVGSRYGTPIRFDDFNPKNWYKVEVTGKNLSANKYWTIFFSTDGVSFSPNDASGNPMIVQDDVKHTFFLPRTATSTTLYPLYQYISMTNTPPPPELIDVQWFAMPQSTKLAQLSVFLLLQGGIRHETSRDNRTADEQLHALETLIQTADPVIMEGPWGEDEYYVARDMRIADTVQGGFGEFSYVVELSIQKRAENSTESL